MRKYFVALSWFIMATCQIPFVSNAQQLSDFIYQNDNGPIQNAVRSETQFNGYTNYWHDVYKDWYRYGNLFKMSVPNAANTIMQAKVDVAEDLHVPGLHLQEGFMNGLLAQPFFKLEDPQMNQIMSAIGNSNVLVATDQNNAVGKELMKNYNYDTIWKQKLKSHQFSAAGFVDILAFMLSKGDRKIFVVASSDSSSRKRVMDLITNAKTVLEKFDLKKGWFGAETLLKSVTCGQGHPLDIIAKGMNEGNSWFTFSGYMEFFAKDELAEWISKAALPVVADVGFSPVYGCKDYDGLQVQDMATKQAWIDFAHKKQGYVFRPVYDPESDPYHYDGVIAGEGNKEQVDNEDVPFVTTTGQMEDDLLTSMVLFTPKGEPLTKQLMWDAILHRREVAVLAQGKMMGPSQYRNALEMLLLDRVFVEEYFGDRVDVQASITDYTLTVNLTNTYSKPVAGDFQLKLPEGIKSNFSAPGSITIPAGNTKTITIKLNPSAAAMGHSHAVAVYFKWDKVNKGSLALLDLPPTISMHQLLYAHAPTVHFPVSIHNFSANTSFPVEVQVFEKNNVNKPVFTSKQTVTTPQASFKDIAFELGVQAGDYNVKVSALGVNFTSQLGVGKAEGHSYAYPVDLNSDGVNEYRLENDSVQITLLATGARVIEYIVKSRKDNVLFKLWPEKANDDRRAFRKRGYYPYGGFEDFLGQGSMETHKLYDVQVIKSKGDYVQVKMVADYFGNRLEKTFTLYGNSPLLEIRFALTFKNPEANVIGPQPILELGASHGTEDVFTVPAMEGNQQIRMRPEEYFGHIFKLKEGWNAGYDTKEDITFVGAYPVTQPLFLHVWMNHPRNGDAHYYYTEFQPWTPIIQKTTMYFSYYMWGAAGPWENGVRELRKRNLVTERPVDKQ